MSMSEITASFAEHVALELYGLQAKAKPLVGEYDKNFHLELERGEFVLKIMGSQAERETLELQIAALEHIARQNSELNAPRVQQTKKNTLIESIDAPDGKRLVWLLSYIPGKLYAHVKPHTPELLESFGGVLASFDKALLGFEHPAAKRNLKWDLAKAEWTVQHLQDIADERQRTMTERILENYLQTVQPALSEVRSSVIHNDANNYNVLVDKGVVTSLIDFGDMLYTATINELAIAAAYAMMDHEDSLGALVNIVRGYHSVLPLTRKELELLFPLVQTRLAVSVTNSAIQKRLRPDDLYVVISEKPAWELLEKLEKIPPRLAYYSFLEACSLETPNAKNVVNVLKKYAGQFAPILGAHLESYHVLDLTPSSSLYSGDPRQHDNAALSKVINAEMAEHSVDVAIGRYDEPRLLYTSSMVARTNALTSERRTVHIGLDLFAKAGTPIYAPLEGTIEAFANNTDALDYGPVIVLRHELDGIVFYTLYGHLSLESLQDKRKGQVIKKGKTFATLGATPINGDWPPHLHFQILVF